MNLKTAGGSGSRIKRTGRMINLLIADDDNVSRLIVEKSARDQGFKVFTAVDGYAAMNIIREKGIQIAILDWMMPRVSGIELCRQMRRQNESEYQYIILCTARTQSGDIVKGLNAGADDYITKPYNIKELEARLRIGKRIIDLQHKLMRTQEKLKRLAIHDSLTNLLNRGEISRILEEQWIQTRREKRPLGVIMLDIDHFKTVNDRYGHQAGDAVLVEVSRRLKECMRPYDKVGRYGGEEFLVLLPNCDQADTEKIAERIRSRVCATPVTAFEHEHHITISLGGTVVTPEESTPAETVLNRSDMALYHAKANGRDRVEMEFHGEPSPQKGETYATRSSNMGTIQ
ncbi:MAG: diguanylate cyclase [Candidatus Aminicenantes bacterium]|nr:diguanylate cyclase [Candidatus Aminicenantes bacterium]